MTISDILAASGMTMKQLSNRFNIPYRTVQDWKAGIRTPPDYVLHMICELLNLPSD